jgi:hypothetical protein
MLLYRGKTEMKLAKTLAIVACAGLLSVGAIGSAPRAYAGGYGPAAGDSAGVGASKAGPSVGTAPDSVPDFEGCWAGINSYGYLEDDNYGPGIGWIGIDQRGKTILGPKNHSYFEFYWEDGAAAYGGVKGKVTKHGFVATGEAGLPCEIKFIGQFGTDDDIFGTYKTIHCPKKHDFDAIGTFDLPYNPDGCVDIIPMN